MTALRDLPIAVIDYETTGVDPATCAPVSVAVFHGVLGSRSGLLKLAQYQLFDPGCPIPEGATQVHGITDEMVRGCPRPEDVPLAIDGRTIIAYNAPYDGVIARRIWGGVPMPWLDPLVWVRHIDRYTRGKRLTDAVRRRGLEIRDAHDALADALHTWALARRLLDELAAESGRDWRAGTLDRLWSWQCRRALEQERDMAQYMARQGRDYRPAWGPLLGDGASPAAGGTA